MNFQLSYSFKRLLMVVIAWRLIITLVSFICIQLLPYQPTFPYYEDFLRNFGSRLLTTWGQFDGVHYLTIISKGYGGAELIQAFFPMYPLLVKFLSFSILNPIWVGVIISTICFVIGLHFLYKLICLDETQFTAIKVLLLVILSPTAFFFTSLYTESLFFLLVVSCFYAARTKHWWIAGILGAFASATRLVGLFLVPALIFEFFNQKRSIKNLSTSSTLLPFLGVGSYMVYLSYRFQDALLFYHAQQNFGTARVTGKIILLYQVFYRYLKMFITVPIQDRLYLIVTQEFIGGFVGMLTLVSSWFVTRRSYVVFGVLAYLTPTFTGTFSSLPRYLLPVFPIYIVIAKLLPRWLFILTLVVSAIMLTINLVLFTQGLWVA